MADLYKATVMYGGNKRLKGQLNEFQLNDIEVWQKQMDELKAKRKQDEAEAKKKEREDSGISRGRVLLPKIGTTKIAEVLSLLYGNTDPVLRALMQLKK
jgi:hypothetical protein